MKYFCNVCLSDVKKTDEGYFCENCNDIVAKNQDQLIPESRTRIINKDTQTYKKGERVLEKRGGKREGLGRPALNKVRLHAFISQESKNMLSRLASESEVSMSDIVDTAIKSYYKEHQTDKFDENRLKGKEIDSIDIDH